MLPEKAHIRFYVLLTLMPFALAYQQYFTLNNENTGDVLNIQTHEPDIGQVIVEGGWTSYCVLGFWVLHLGANYSGEYPLINPSWYNGSPRCGDWEYDLPNVKSLRYGAALESTQTAASFYSEEDYRGQEFYLDTAAAVNLQARSFLTSGHMNTSWTLYEGLWLDGKSVCYSHDPQHSDLLISGVWNVTKYLPFPVIGSAHAGCSSDCVEFSSEMAGKFKEEDRRAISTGETRPIWSCQ